MSCKYTSLLSPLKSLSFPSFVGASLSVFRKLALLCAIILFSVSASAWTVNGLNYTVTSGKNVKLTGCSTCPSNGTLVVPSTVTYNRTTYTVTEIGYEAFLNSTSCNIVSLTVPGTVKVINMMAFKNMKTLKNLYLSEGLEEIWSGAFENCDIEYLEIPSTVTKIQAHSFKNNTNLCTVIVKGPPSILSTEGCADNPEDKCDWFNSKASNCPSGQTCNYCKDVKLYVPIEYYQQYFEDESWNAEFDHITTREYVEDLFDIDLSEKVYDGTTDYSINDIKFNCKAQIDEDFLKTVIFKVTGVILSGSDKDSPDVSCNHSVVVTIGYGNDKVQIPMRSNQVSGDYCIVPKELTLDPSGTTTTITKVYDGSTIVDPSDIVLPTLYGVVDADVDKVKLQLCGEVTTTSQYVGDYANVDIPFILTGDKAKNYKLPEEIENTKDANGVYHLTATVTITPRSLSLTCDQITVNSKTYDGSDDFKKQYFSYPALTEWGVLAEDTDKFTVEIRANTGNANVGTYSTTVIVYLTSDSNNELKKSYGIYENGDSKKNPLLTCTKELTISPKEITTISYKLDVAPHTYDCSTDDKDDVTISNISVGSAGEVIGSDADNLSLGVASATLETPNVTSSTTTTVVVELTGNASGNYVFNLKPGSATKTVNTSVIPAQLNISGSPSIADHAYDGTTNAINDVNVGTINLTGIASCDSDFTPTVKSAVLSQSSPTGGCDGHDATCTAEVTVNFKDSVLANYTITGATKVSATEYTKSYTLTTHITPRLISPNYTLTATNRVYNAKKDVVVSYKFNNWGDGVLAADQKNLQLKAGDGYMDDKNVGNAKTVNVPLTLLGSAKSYYKLTDDCSDLIATTTVKISQYPFQVDASIIPDAFNYDCDNTVDNINETINKNLKVYYDAVVLTDENGKADNVYIEVDNSQLRYSNGTWTVTSTLSLRGDDRGNYSLSPNQFTKTVIVSMDDVTPSDADISKVNAQSVTHTYDCTTDAKDDYAGPDRIAINGLCSAGELYYELTSVTLDNANVGIASKATVVYTLAGSALSKQEMYGLASTLSYTIPAEVVAASLTVDASSIPSSISHSYDGSCSLSTSELSQIPSTLSTVKNPTNSCDALVYDRVSVVMSGCPDVTTNASTTVTYSLTDASDQTLKNYGLTSRNYVVTIPTTITALPIEVTVALNTNCIECGTTDVKDYVYATISTSPIYGDVNVVVESATGSYNYYWWGDCKDCNITVNVTLSGSDAGNYVLSKTQYTLSDVDVCDDNQLTVKGLQFQDHVYDCGTDVSGDVIVGPYVEIPNKKTGKTDKVNLNCESATISDKNVGVRDVTAKFSVTLSNSDYDRKYYISEPRKGSTSKQTWEPKNYKINVVEAELSLSGLPSIPDEIEYSGSTDVTSLVNLGTVSLSGFLSCDTEVKGVIRSATLGVPSASVDCNGNGSSSPVTVVVEFNSSTLTNYTSDAVVKESSSVWTKTYNLSTTVKPKTISPTVSSIEITPRLYDGTTTIDPTTVTINSDIDNLKVSSDDVYLEVETATLGDKHAGDAKSVTVVYKLSGADADNYALAGCADNLKANATVKISPYPLDLTDNVTVKSQTFTCDKSIKVSDVTVTAPTALSGDKLTASVESASYLKGSDSWVATVYLKLASAKTSTLASDYTLVPNPVTKSITVNPTSVSIIEPTVSTVNHTYDCTGDIYDDYLNAVGSDVVKINGLCSDALTAAVYYKLTSVVLSSTNYNVSDNTIKATATYTLQGTSYQNLDRSLYTNLEDTYVKEFNVKIVPAKLSVVEPTWPSSLTHAYDGTLVMTGDEIADVPTTLATTITPANGCDVLTYQLKSVTLDKEFGMSSNPATATALYELVGYNSTILKNHGLSDQYYKKTFKVTVTPRELTVTPEINSCITYTGSATVDLKYITTPAVTGIADVDNGKVTITASKAVITAGDANVGTSKVVTVTYIITGGNGARYTLANGGKFTVSDVEICPAPLTPSGALTLTSRAYDCTRDIAVTSVPYVTVSGKKYNLEVSSAVQTLSANAGTYTVSVNLCLPDEFQANYDLADGGDCVTKKANVTISKAELTVTGEPTVATHTYDGTTDASAETSIASVALSGMSCSESYPASLTSSTLGQKDATDACGQTATTTTAAVLVKFAGVDTNNYTIKGAESDGVSYAFTVSGIHILPKEIAPAVTAPALADKVYDAEKTIDPALVTLNYDLSSLKAASSDDLALSVVSATMEDKNAGKDKTVTIEYALSGASAANYKLAGCANGKTSSTITITPKELDYTGLVTVKSQTYNCDGSMSISDVTVGNHSGIYSDDDVEASVLSATYAQAGTVWTASVTIALSGDDSANYTITPNPVSESVTVSRKPISFTEPTVSALSHTYDCSTDVTADYTAAGGPSTIAVSGLCDGLDVHYQLQAVTIPSAHVSTYTVKATYVLAGSGLTEFNATRDLYSAIDDTYEKTVTVTVTPATLTINDGGIPSSLEHTYDGTTSFTAAEIEGLVPETLTTTGGCDALTYGLTSVTISSPEAGSTTATIRYDLSKSDAQTLKDYGLDKSYVEYTVPVTVKQRELTVEPSLTVACVPYTGSTDVSAYISNTLSGVQNGDAVSVTLASATIDNPDVTTGDERRTITLVYTLDKSAKSGNYTLANDGKYTITAEVCAADLFVSGMPTVIDHVYDGSDDASADVDISYVYVAGVNDGEICAPTLVSAKLSQIDVTTPCGNSTVGHCVATVVVKFDCPFLSNYTVAGLSDDGEYTFTINGVQIVPVTIDPSVTASVDSRIYNAKKTIAAGDVHFTSNISDFVIGDDEINLVVTGAKMDSKNVGTDKPVSVYYELAGADADNYKLADCHTDSVATTVDVEPYVIDVYDKVVIASNTVFNCNGTLDASEVTLPANAEYNTLSDENGNPDDIDLDIISSSFTKNGDNWTASVLLSISGSDAANYILEPNPIEKDITVGKAEAEFDKPGVATVEHVFDCSGNVIDDYTGPVALNFNGLCDRFADIHYELASAQISGSDYNVGNHDGSVEYVLKGTNIEEFLSLYNVNEQYILDVVVNVKSASLDNVLPEWPTEIVHVYDGKNVLTDDEIDALGIARSFVAVPNPLGKCENLTYTLESVTLSEVNANVDGTVATLTYKLNGFDSVVKMNYGLDDEFFTKEISARIEPRELTVTASIDGCFTYNGSTEISSADYAHISNVVTNKVEGDDVDVKIASATIISGDENVGNGKTISVSYELVGSDSGNYILNDGGVYTLNDASVCVATLVVKGDLTFNEHIYDCSTDVKSDVAELPYVETLDDEKVFLTLNVATSTDKNVGNHLVNATLTLDGLSNYVIESTGTNEIEINTSSIEIVQRVLTIADDAVVTKLHSYDCSTTFNGELTTPSLNNISCDEAVSLALVSAELNTANCGPAVLTAIYKLDGDSEIVKNYRLADDTKNIETSIEKVVVNVDCVADVNIEHTFDCSNDVYADANLVAGHIDIDPSLVCGTTGVRYVLASATIDDTESNTLGSGKSTTLVYRLEGLDDDVMTYYSLDAEKVCSATTEVKASTITFSEPVIPAYIEHVYDCSNDVKTEFVANGGTEKVRVTGMCAMDGSDVYYELVSVEMYSADGVYVPSEDAYETTATYVLRNMTQDEANLYSLPVSFTRTTSAAVVPDAVTPVCPSNLTVNAHTYNFSGDVTADYSGASEVDIDVCGKNAGDVKYVFSRAEITDESGFAVGSSRETTVYFSLSGLTEVERSYFTLPESMSCQTTTVVEPAVATIVADAEVSDRVYNGSRELDAALVKLPTINVVDADNNVVSLPSEAIAMISATLDDKNVGSDKQATISFQLMDDFANNFIFENAGTTADITVGGIEVSKLLITLDAAPQLSSKSCDGTSAILESQVTMPNITNIQVDDEGIEDNLYLTFIGERSHINGTDFNVGAHTATVALGIGGDDAKNYYLEPDEWSDLNVDITPQKLTIVGQFSTTETRVYNGKTGLDISQISVPELYYADGTLVNPDDVHIVVTEANLADKNAGDAKKVIIKYELSSDNYTIGDDASTSGVDENMTIDVDKLDVVLNPSEPVFPEEKKYDCLTHVDMVSEPVVDNVMTDDAGVLDDVYLSSTESDLDDANVGVRTATYSVELLGADKDNYRLTADTWSANVTVTPAELTLDLSNVRLDTHVYDCGTDVLADFVDKTNVLTATGFTACHEDAYFELVSATIGNPNVGLTHTTLKFELRGADLSDYGLTEDDLIFTINTEVQPAKLIVNSDITIESLPYTGSTDVTEQVKATGEKPVIISGLAACDADAEFEVVSAEVDNPAPGADRKVTIVYTLNGADGRNYGLTESDTVIVVNANIIAKTLTGADKSKLPTHVYDSTTDDSDDFDDANLPDVSAGVIAGDDVYVELVTATLDDPNVGARHTTLVFRLAGADAAKYQLDAETETQVVETEVTPCIVSPNADAIVAGRDYDGTDNVYAESVTLPTFGTVYDVDIDDVQLEFVSGTLDDSQIGARTATIYLALSGDKAYNYKLDPDYVLVETEIFDSRKVISVDDNFFVKDRPYDGTTNLADTLITLPNIIGLDPADEGSVYLVIDTAYIDVPDAGERIAVVTVRIEGPKASFYKLDDNVLQTTMNVTKLKVTLDGPVLIDSRKEDGTLDVSDNLIHLPGLDGVLDMDVDDVILSIISARLDSATAGDRTVALDLILTGAKANNYELVVDDPLYVSMKITKDKKDDVKPPHVIDDEIVSEKEMIVYNIEGRIIGKGKQVKVPESGLYVCLIGRHAERILVP